MSAHDHNTTMRRETREEASYEVARAAGLIVAATVDEFKSRMDTQVGAYQFGNDALRRELRQTNDELERHRARASAMEADLRSYDTALDEANRRIVSLSKRARVKPVQIIPVTDRTNVRYGDHAGGPATKEAPESDTR
jgi:chromosome segregation ATPase